ncbi:transposase domain containing protein [Trichonephila clavipes]|nr:transposase domain containing protein [Trichonephila clavipes]
MGRQLRVQRPPIRNISDLCDRCLNIWYNLSPAIYQGLVASMPRRVEALLPKTYTHTIFGKSLYTLIFPVERHMVSRSSETYARGNPGAPSRAHLMRVKE